MKILHLCLSASYIEGLSYQENLLPQYHKKMGYDVDVIASLKTFNSNGEYVYDSETADYVNKHGVHVVKLAYKKPEKIGKLLKTYVGTYGAIEASNPDVIFMHGVQFWDSNVVRKYMKAHPNVKLYADNHSDFSNSAMNWVSKNIQHKILWRHCVHRLDPFVIKYWGVLPARVDFLINMYHLPKEKVELLVMGADDELVKKAESPEVRKEIREKYGFAPDDFVIVNGGKIDQWKKQTLQLMDAVNRMDDPKVKLLVFGSVTPELKEEVNDRCSERVKYIGWVQSEDSYPLFAAGDIACFPGRHSVFWEQVAGQGIPMICKRWDGTTHVDCGGNVLFLDTDGVDQISGAISVIRNDPDVYQKMKGTAENVAKRVFSYTAISARAIEAQNQNNL